MATGGCSSSHRRQIADPTISSIPPRTSPQSPPEVKGSTFATVPRVICASCGHRNTEGGAFCASCGARLSGASGDEVTATIAPVVTPADPEDDDIALAAADLEAGAAVLVV